jgi:2-methylcitrate dehydratase PrpD
MLAVALAQAGHVGGETVLEGDAGFYHAYAGNNQGLLTYSFDGRTHADLPAMTRDLGREWMFLETLYRIYSVSGYNLAHIEVTAQLCEERDIRYEDVDRVEAVVNWLETQYPSPAFPSRREDLLAGAGSTAYHTAFGVVQRGFPMLREWAPQSSAADDPPEVLDLMKRVKIIPSHTMPLFGPRITIFTKDGRSHVKQGTGREFIWDFEVQARRIRAVAPVLPVPAARFDEIIEACRHLDRLERADTLVRLTLG